jgi:hypothetical protein
MHGSWLSCLIKCGSCARLAGHPCYTISETGSVDKRHSSTFNCSQFKRPAFLLRKYGHNVYEVARNHLRSITTYSFFFYSTSDNSQNFLLCSPIMPVSRGSLWGVCSWQLSAFSRISTTADRVSEQQTCFTHPRTLWITRLGPVAWKHG